MLLWLFILLLGPMCSVVVVVVVVLISYWNSFQFDLTIHGTETMFILHSKVRSKVT